MCRAVWWWARAAEAGCPWFRVADGGSSTRSLALVVWVCPGLCTRLHEVLVSFWCKSESVLKSEFSGRGESLLPGPHNVKLFPCKAADFGNALHLMYHEGCEESQEKKKKRRIPVDKHLLICSLHTSARRKKCGLAAGPVMTFAEYFIGQRGPERAAARGELRARPVPSTRALGVLGLCTDNSVCVQGEHCHEG